MHFFKASIIKEFLLLTRDLHAMLVLFLMPTVFVLIMSLALQDNFEGKSSVSLAGKIQDSEEKNGETQNYNNNSHSAYFISSLQQNPYLDLSGQRTKTLFTIYISEQFDLTIEEGLQSSPAILLSYSEEVGRRERALIKAAVEQAFALTNVRFLAEDLGYDEAYGRKTFLKEGAVAEIGENISEQTDSLIPSATQQNVPAWTVFAMFFVSIPVSTTMISERKQKTLMRLRTLNVSSTVFYLAKLLPYLLVNYCQLFLILIIGVFVLPLLGGQALSMNISLPGLLAICTSTSVAALGFAALIATVSTTTEQATIYSGVGSIIFGALGGIMVPTFIMPPMMQNIALVSPMGWSLQGFLDIVLRGGGLADIGTECAVLCVFGCTLLAVALIKFKTEKYI